jgi:predicted TIM-barrel fold metal-dependent hydrolase
LARSGHDPGHDRSGVAILSAEFADHARPDWRPAQGKPGSSLEDMQAQALDRFGVSYGICNPLYGVQMVFSEDMADAFCRALNDWLAKEWLDRTRGCAARS